MLLTKHIDRERTAPELFGTYWLNSAPISVRSLRGQCVLLFFWDHTSTASLRLIKEVNRLQALYGDCGLIVIGVQVPEYVIARDPAKKEAIIRSCGIEFPVVTDDEHHIADSYRIDTLPALCLIAPKGDIYDTQTPRNSLSRIERSIQYLLRQGGYFGELPYVEYTDAQYVNFSPANCTPDFDMGYLHGSLGNIEGYNPELPADYQDPLVHVEGKFYAQGVWIAGRTSFEFAGEGHDGYILFPYTGSDVDIVVGNETDTDSIVVTMDELPMELSMQGEDIIVDGDGLTVLKINTLKSAHLVSNRAISAHTIRLTPSKKGTTFYKVSMMPYEPSDDTESAPFHTN